MTRQRLLLVLRVAAWTAVAGCVVVFGAFSQSPQGSARKAIHLPSSNPQLPFSDGILAGNTLYLSGRIGLDGKTGQAPANIDDEIRNLFEAAHERVRRTLTAKREVLTSLAKLLIEKEVVSRDDLTALLASAEG